MTSRTKKLPLDVEKMEIPHFKALTVVTMAILIVGLSIFRFFQFVFSGR